MTDETPQILQRKPGEPGGEKARAAKELFDSLSDHAPIPTVLLNEEQFTRAVAGALAACALAEAKWWEHRLSALNAFDCRESRQVMELIHAMDTLRRDATERMDTMERGGTER